MDLKLFGNVVTGIHYNFIVKQLGLKLPLNIDVPKVRELEVGPRSANSKTIHPGLLLAFNYCKTATNAEQCWNLASRKEFSQFIVVNHLCNLSLGKKKEL